MTQTATPKVELFDTSLRDGLQQPDLEISVPNAVLLLQRMAAFGVRYAEIGFAGANQFVSDLTGSHRVRRRRRNATGPLRALARPRGES